MCDSGLLADEHKHSRSEAKQLGCFAFRLVPFTGIPLAQTEPPLASSWSNIEVGMLADRLPL